MRKTVSAAQIAAATGLDISTIYRWVETGVLPAPFKPTQRTTRWWADEVEAALDDLREAA